VLQSILNVTYENFVRPKNINMSFNNNSNVAIDILVFLFYSDQLVIDVETGIVTKQFFIVLL
jgi:hypothetical protein